MNTNNGCRAKFTAEGGYDFQQEEAKKNLVIGKHYKIQDAKVGRNSSDVKVLGHWYNSVLFDISVQRIIKWFPESVSSYL